MKKYPERIYSNITDTQITWGPCRTKEEAVLSAEKDYDINEQPARKYIVVGLVCLCCIIGTFILLMSCTKLQAGLDRTACKVCKGPIYFGTEPYEYMEDGNYHINCLKQQTITLFSHDNVNCIVCLESISSGSASVMTGDCLYHFECFVKTQQNKTA